ncbi:ABC transporter ATP-binding protein [Pseudaeromonas sp. ZJS20]|uniref:ABC transporter ATP-binding protein n=1 Tax=Pseudaeromonas aegiceratis TaxID=3153928 RepID=UPI00390CB48C
MQLEVSELQLGYDRLIVKRLSLSLSAGQLMILIGPNGCGKSTLLKSLAGQLPPQQGEIRLDGTPLTDFSPRALARRIAYLPQSPLAPDGLRVRDLVAYGRHPHQGLFRQWSAADEAAVEQALADTDLSELADRRLEAISGGQRQRAWLALALAQQADLLLLDEPVSMLDLGHQLEVMELVHRLSRQGRAIIMVLHDLMAAARYADVLVAMRDGQLVAAGKPAEVLTPERVAALYDVQAQILTAPGDGSPVVVPVLGQRSEIRV